MGAGTQRERVRERERGFGGKVGILLHWGQLGSYTQTQEEDREREKGEKTVLFFS